MKHLEGGLKSPQGSNPLNYKHRRFKATAVRCNTKGDGGRESLTPSRGATVGGKSCRREMLGARSPSDRVQESPFPDPNNEANFDAEIIVK